MRRRTSDPIHTGQYVPQIAFASFEKRPTDEVPTKKAGGARFVLWVNTWNHLMGEKNNNPKEVIMYATWISAPRAVWPRTSVCQRTPLLHCVGLLIDRNQPVGVQPPEQLGATRSSMRSHALRVCGRSCTLCSVPH